MEEQALFLDMMDYWTLNIGADTRSLPLFFTRKFRLEALENIQDSLRLRSLPDAQTRLMAQRIWDSLVGQALLFHLLEDERVSDIKILAHDQIRLKALGVRKTASFYFQSKNQYLHFIEYLLSKNELQLLDNQSVLSFCDTVSRPEDILCFHISSRRINSVSTPYLHVHRIPKKKKRLKDLVSEGFLTSEAARHLAKEARQGGCLLFTGSDSRRQRILINALLDLIPHDRSALAIQETEELFSLSHPEIMFQHTAPSSRTNAACDTRELMEYGLLLDSDYYILDELTQENALPFWKAASRGCRCWTTLPAPNASQALQQMTDFLCRETLTPREQVLASLRRISCVICLNKNRPAELVLIRGWDDRAKDLELMRLFPTMDADA